MNFVKSAWKSMFNKQQNEDKKQQQQTIEKNKKHNQQQQEQIPEQVLEQLFTLSAQFIKQSNISDNNIKLKIYSLYKQATQGNCTTPQPQVFDFIGRSKWNAWTELKGLKKTQAMAQYIKLVNEVDPSIINKIHKHFEGQQIDQNQNQQQQVHNQNEISGIGYKKVKQVDYSDEYSHPYFKAIQKMEDIKQISHQLLLQKNNQPNVYPLHFAIDKERIDLVQLFLKVLTKEEIMEMKDGEGMTILQYAQLIQNQQILEMVKNKLMN